MFQGEAEEGLDNNTARQWLRRLLPTLDTRFNKFRLKYGLTQNMYDCLKEILQSSREESDEEL